jgi:tetratricopeptide (TPR) repeat protein
MEAQGNYAESIRLYQEAVKQDPQNALAWRDMGNVYYKLGKKAYALQCFEKVSELRPSDKAFGEWLEKFKVPNP